jgi:serine/threonine protein kinase
VTDHLPTRFEEVTFLAQGGMGEVYRAYDHLTGQAVVVKTMRPNQSPERFEREVVAIASIEHPNVVKILAWEFATPTRWYAMPWYSHGSLADRLDSSDSPLLQEDALRLVQQVSAGLSAVLSPPNSVGVVHRDLKPSNIMFNESQAVVADFGLAGPTTDGSDRITGSLLVMGTLNYMSPEQSLGRTTDPRTDVYSLGLILVEMLTGDTPTVPSDPSRDWQERFPRLSPTVLDDRLGSLKRPIEKALSVDPVMRFHTARQFSDSLKDSRRFPNGLVAPNGGRYRPQIFNPTNPQLLSAIRDHYQPELLRLIEPSGEISTKLVLRDIEDAVATVCTDTEFSHVLLVRNDHLPLRDRLGEDFEWVIPGGATPIGGADARLHATNSVCFEAGVDPGNITNLEPLGPHRYVNESAWPDSLYHYYPDNSRHTRRIYLFRATVDRAVPLGPGSLETRWVPVSEALDMVWRNEIHSSWTVIALLAEHLRRYREPSHRTAEVPDGQI